MANKHGVLSVLTLNQWIGRCFTFVKNLGFWFLQNELEFVFGNGFQFHTSPIPAPVARVLPAPTYAYHGTSWPFCPWNGLHFFIESQLVNFFLVSDQWVFFFGSFFFLLKPDLYTTFPPNYPTNLAIFIDLGTFLTYILALPTSY
jgi:hypothetical protein